MTSQFFLFCTLWLSICSFSACSQAPNVPPPNSMPMEGWSEHCRKSTVSIGVQHVIAEKLSFDAIGSGVIVARQTNLHTYIGIVTAKHVLEKVASAGNRSVQVRFASEFKSLSDDNGFTLPIQKASKKLWVAANDGADIAIVPLTSEFTLQFSTEKLSITDGIGTQSLGQASDLYQGEPILVFGFPSDVGVLMGRDALVRAVARSGVVSWTPDPPEGPFMIDANILEGNSGGPIFSVPTGADRFGGMVISQSVKLLGIVTETVGNEYVHSLGGLGRAEPASEIQRLMDRVFPVF